MIDNRHAFTLAARIGCAELADRIGLYGDLFLIGVGPHGTAEDVPPSVVGAAERSGLLRAPDLGTTQGGVASRGPCPRWVTGR
jgi:hypothetical protein